MNWIKREFGYPILRDGDIVAVKDKEKAEMLAKNFVKKYINQAILVTRGKEEGKERWNNIKT